MDSKFKEDMVTETITQDEKLVVYQGMRHYGSPFIRAFAETLMLADKVNTRLFKETWPDLWAGYKEKWEKYLETRKEDEDAKTES